jgi:thymidylate synthase (FAD)
VKLIKPSFEILEQLPGLEGMYKQIELAGRTCYKSEDKITEDSAKEFVDRMIKSGHGAMLEHGTVYLYHNNARPGNVVILYNKYKDNKFSKAVVKTAMDDLSNRGIPFRETFITTNLRVLVENNWLDDLQYICEPTEHHEKRHTVKFTCDRGVSHEFVRHRVFSFAQESTRYCNYSKDKFGNEITYIQPCWEMQKDEEELFLLQLEQAQNSYNALISSGWKAQEARSILPNALKTELVMTGFESDWEHFFFLRTPGSAHPQARELAIPLKEEFIKRNYIKQ